MTPTRLIAAAVAAATTAVLAWGPPAARPRRTRGTSSRLNSDATAIQEAIDMTPKRLIAAAVAIATTAVLAWGPTAVLAGITLNGLD